MKRDCEIPVLMVCFLKRNCLSDLNFMFAKRGIRGMLAGKECQSVDMVFFLIAGLFDRGTGFVREAPMTRFHCNY